MKMFMIVLFSVLSVIYMAATVFCGVSAGAFFANGDELAMLALMSGVFTFLSALVSGVAIYKVLKGRLRVPLSAFLMSATVLFLSAGIMYMFPPFSDPAAFFIFLFIGVAFAFMAVLAGIGGKGVFLKKQEAAREAERYRNGEMFFRGFVSFRTADQIKAATDEYVKVSGLVPETGLGADDGESSVSLSEYDLNRIKEYSCMPFVYLFAWLVYNGHMSEAFMRKYGSEKIDLLQRKITSPLDFMLGEMNGEVSRADISSDIYAFVNNYWALPANRTANAGTRWLVFDYWKAAGMSSGAYYCNGFSWDISAELEETISMRYEEFREGLFSASSQEPSRLSSVYDRTRNSIDAANLLSAGELQRITLGQKDLILTPAAARRAREAADLAEGLVRAGYAVRVKVKPVFEEGRPIPQYVDISAGNNTRNVFFSKVGNEDG